MGNIVRRKLTRADLALWDGNTKNYSATDATGGSISELTIGDYIDVLETYGDGSTRDVATIIAAYQGVGSNVCTFRYATGTWTIDANLTIPSTIANYIPSGCTFSISSGITLTFSGPVHVEYSASDGTGWYSGSGTVSCSVGASGFPGW